MKRKEDGFIIEGVSIEKFQKDLAELIKREKYKSRLEVLDKINKLIEKHLVEYSEEVIGELPDIKGFAKEVQRLRKGKK